MPENGCGVVAGFILAWMIEDEAHILKLATRREYRRTGVAGALTKNLLEHLEAKGIKSAYLEVRETNFNAQRFYAGLGFRKVGLRKAYYPDTAEAAVILRKDLDYAGS